MSRSKQVKKPKPKRRKFRLTMKKYFKIPETPKGMPAINGKLYDFVQCMTYIIDNEPRFNEKSSDSRKGNHILDALEDTFKVGEDTWCEVEEDALRHLVLVLESPKCGFHDQNLTFMGPDDKPLIDLATGSPKTLSIPTRRFLPYVDAPSEATSTDPRPKEPKEAKENSKPAAEPVAAEA
jgi:hypothetical protein